MCVGLAGLFIECPARSFAESVRNNLPLIVNITLRNEKGTLVHYN